MAIVRWNPLGGLAAVELERINRLFSDLQSDGTRAWVPAVDIYETDDHEVVIKAELPDIKKEDIGVTFENGVLTLSGERKQEESVQKGHVRRLERRRWRPEQRERMDGHVRWHMYTPVIGRFIRGRPGVQQPRERHRGVEPWRHDPD